MVPGDEFYHSLDSYSARFRLELTLHYLGSFLVTRSSARVIGARINYCVSPAV